MSQEKQQDLENAYMVLEAYWQSYQLYLENGAQFEDPQTHEACTGREVFMKYAPQFMLYISSLLKDIDLENRATFVDTILDINSLYDKISKAFPDQELGYLAKKESAQASFAANQDLLCRLNTNYLDKFAINQGIWPDIKQANALFCELNFDNKHKFTRNQQEQIPEVQDSILDLWDHMIKNYGESFCENYTSHYTIERIKNVAKILEPKRQEIKEKKFASSCQYIREYLEYHKTNKNQLEPLTPEERVLKDERTFLANAKIGHIIQALGQNEARDREIKTLLNDVAETLQDEKLRGFINEYSILKFTQYESATLKTRQNDMLNATDVFVLLVGCKNANNDISQLNKEQLNKLQSYNDYSEWLYKQAATWDIHLPIQGDFIDKAQEKIANKITELDEIQANKESQAMKDAEDKIELEAPLEIIQTESKAEEKIAQTAKTIEFDYSSLQQIIPLSNHLKQSTTRNVKTESSQANTKEKNTNTEEKQMTFKDKIAKFNQKKEQKF